MNKQFRVAGRLAIKLEELGVPVSAVLRRAGLPQDLFQQTRVLVNAAALFALWKAIAEVSKEPSIGLKLGTETLIEHSHPSALAALSTETFGAAIDHMARCNNSPARKKLHTPSAMTSGQFSFGGCSRSMQSPTP